MRVWLLLVSAALGTVTVAPAQQFAFTHRMLPADTDSTEAVALGDVDGDGDLDALIGNEQPNFGVPDRLYLNGGAAVFTDATATNLPVLPFPSETRALALGDVDEDGDLDAFLGKGQGTSSGTEQSRLFLNGGGGGFTDATATEMPALPGGACAVALGDLDGDADLDAIVPFTASPTLHRLYTNLSRHLAWRAFPRAGKPLTLDLRGTAGGTWLLAASPVSATLPLPPFGTLRLSPSTLFVVAGGPLDPQGRASLTFPVPAYPTFLGFSLYWQAVVGPPFLFTSLEITTVTAL